MACGRSGDNGCDSCAALLTLWCRLPRRQGNRQDLPASRETAQDCPGVDDDSGSKVVPLSFLAFVVPVVAGVATVPLVESRGGAAVAAIAGLVVAGVTSRVCAALVRTVPDRSMVDCLDPRQCNQEEQGDRALRDRLGSVDDRPALSQSAHPTGCCEIKR